MQRISGHANGVTFCEQQVQALSAEGFVSCAGEVRHDGEVKGGRIARAAPFCGRRHPLRRRTAASSPWNAPRRMGLP